MLLPLTRRSLLIFFSVSSALPSALFCLASGVLSGCDKPGPARPDATAAAPSKGTSHAPITEAAGLHATELVTAGGDPEAPLPLVIALHGLGDRGSSYLSLFTAFPIPARIVALDAPDAAGGGFSWFPRAASIDAAGPGIVVAAKRVAAAIAAIRAARPTRGEPTVTGFSQGGALSYAVALRHPDTVGLAIPIGGWLPRDAWPSPLAGGAASAKKPPAIFGLHGLDDTRVPPDSARELVDELARHGLPAELVIEPNVAHSVSRNERTRLFERIVKAIESQSDLPWSAGAASGFRVATTTTPARMRRLAPSIRDDSTVPSWT